MVCWLSRIWIVTPTRSLRLGLLNELTTEFTERTQNRERKDGNQWKKALARTEGDGFSKALHERRGGFRSAVINSRYNYQRLL